MKKLIEKLQSRKLLSTIAAYGLGLYLIRTGDVTQGIALITGAQASFNIGQGMADARALSQGVALEAVVERISEPVRQ